MATPAYQIQTIYQDVLANYLISMARTVESSVESALEALLHPNMEAANELSSKVFLVEPRVNEMEILIDDHAVRMLRTGLLDDEEIRRVVASQKISNDLERIGDLAVNISERVISLAGMNVTETPKDLEPMAGAVRGMLGRSLGALIFRNVVLAGEVLEADDVVDRYRDQIFENLLVGMTEEPARSRRNCNSCWPLVTWSASRTTPRTSLKTLFSGCGAWTCATAGRGQVLEAKNYPSKRG